MQQLITESFMDNLINTHINPTIQKIMIEVNLDKSALAKHVKTIYRKDLISITLPEYAKFIDSGRKPGSKPPPIKAILKWIKDRGINPEPSSNPSKSANKAPEEKVMTDEQLAFAISKAIATNGVKPKPFIQRLIEFVTDIVKIKITDELKKSIINQLTNKP
jgi:hypothetical protein